MMKCHELMKRPRVCHEDDTVEKVARTMRSADIGFLPVVDGYNRVVGTITDRDLAIRVLADRLPPKTPVGNVMSTDPIASVFPEDDLSIAESRMARMKKSRLVVTDAYGHCLGVISLSDIGQTGDAVRAGRLLNAVTEREAVPPPSP